jgi:hypothetical protein
MLTRGRRRVAHGSRAVERLGVQRESFAYPHAPETMIAGLILALASALATNVAFLFKHRGA